MSIAMWNKINARMDKLEERIHDLELAMREPMPVLLQEPYKQRKEPKEAPLR